MPPHNYGYGRQHSPEEDLTDADRFAPHNNSSSNGTLIRSNMRKQHRDVRNKKLSSSLNTASTDSTAANILMQRVMASGRRGSLSLEDEFSDANNHLKDRTALNQHDCPTSPPHSQAVQETFHKYKEIYDAMLQGVFDDLDDLDCKLVHHNRSDDSSTTAEVTVEPSSPVVDEKEFNVNEDAIVVVDRLQQRDKKRDPPTTSSSTSIDSADADDATPTPIEDRGVDPPTTTALTLHNADNSMISDSDDRSKTLADLVADFHELQDIQSQDALSNDDLQSHDVMSLISSKFHHQKDGDKLRGEDLKEEEEKEGSNNKEKKEDALVLVEKKTGNMKEKENALVPVDKKKRSSSNDRGRQRKSRRPSTGKEQSNSSEDVKKSHHQGSKPSSPRKSSRSPHHGRRRTRSPSPTPPNNNGAEKGAARVSRSKSPFDMLRSISSPFGRSTQEDASSRSRYRGRSLSLSWTSNAETTGDEKKCAKLLRKMKSFASSSLKILPSAGSSNSLHKFRVGDMAKYKISSRVRNLDGLDVFTEGDDKLCIVRILEVGEDGVLELPLYKILLPNGAKRKTNSKFLSACSKQQAKESSHRFRYEEDSRRRSRSSSNRRRSSSRSSSRRRSRSPSSSCLSSSSHHSSSNNNNRRSRSSSSRRSSSSSRRSPSPYEKKNSCSGRDRSSSRSRQLKKKSDGDHLTGKSSFGESEVTAKTTNKRRK